MGFNFNKVINDVEDNQALTELFFDFFAEQLKHHYKDNQDLKPVFNKRGNKGIDITFMLRNDTPVLKFEFTCNNHEDVKITLTDGTYQEPHQDIIKECIENVLRYCNFTHKVKLLNIDSHANNFDNFFREGIWSNIITLGFLDLPVIADNVEKVLYTNKDTKYPFLYNIHIDNLIKNDTLPSIGEQYRALKRLISDNTYMSISFDDTYNKLKGYYPDINDMLVEYAKHQKEITLAHIDSDKFKYATVDGNELKPVKQNFFTKVFNSDFEYSSYTGNAYRSLNTLETLKAITVNIFKNGVFPTFQSYSSHWDSSLKYFIINSKKFKQTAPVIICLQKLYIDMLDAMIAGKIVLQQK